MMPTVPVWNGAKLDLLKELWAQKDPETGHPMWSAALIGIKMGCSKNAVIGAAHRNRLEVRESGKTQMVQKRVRGAQIPKNTVVTRVPYRQYRSRRPAMPVEPQRESVFEPLRIPFLKIRRRNQCRSILDERGEDGLVVFCGHRTVEGKSFCEHHAHLYFDLRGRKRGHVGTTAADQRIREDTGQVATAAECGPGHGDQPAAQTSPETSPPASEAA